MKMKRLLASATAVVMSFSLMAGFTVPVASAKTESILPTTQGLYICDWIDFDDDTGKAITDTDQYGNTVLSDEEGNYHEYRDRDGWYFEAVTEDRGPVIEPIKGLWFDYVEGNKVTHVPYNKLIFTNLDGSDLDNISVSASATDSRVVDINAKELKPFLVTYPGAKTNNQMVLNVNLPQGGIYDSATPSMESWIPDDGNKQTIVKGATKSYYLILSEKDNENRGFLLDKNTAVRVCYYDRSKDEDVWYDTPEDTAPFVKLTDVDVTDLNYQVYKVDITFPNGVQSNELSVNLMFRCYNVDDGIENGWDEEQWIHFNVVEPNTLEAIDTNWAVDFVNGELDVSDVNGYSREYYYSSAKGVPIPVGFRYIDASGNLQVIKDKSDLSFYHVENDQIGEKYDPADFSLTWNETSNIGYLDFVNKDEDACFAIVGYRNELPDLYNSIKIDFNPGINQGFFKSDSAAGNYVKNIETDGTKDVTVYFALSDEGGKTTDVELTRFDFHDAKYNDLSAKAKFKHDVPFTFWNEEKAAYALKITIPAGVISTNAKINCGVKLKYEGEETEWTHFNIYFNYKAPAKGTKITKSGVTYKVTGKNTVSVNKVKTSSKKITIPAKVLGKFKVTAIDAKAMSGCKKLTKITVKSKTIKKVGKNAFKGVPKKAVAKVPSSKKKDYKKLFKKGGFKGKVK